MRTVLRIENLSKKYVIGHQQQAGYRTFRDALGQTAKEGLRRLLHPFLSSSNIPFVGLPETEEFWALKDVSFNVGQGDRIGIIGRNGAGKSTLLKILSRITEPSGGRALVKGRVASLLEVGTGFHPELTGRENIFLNGAILGMSKAEIKKKFDAIVAFAEVEKFLDTPVKRFSSGMYVRLAFSVAAHLESEILIVDEVLAVGDAVFQKKCLGKMGDVAREGRTVLFVSHNMQAVRHLCDKGILLDRGRVAYQGNSDEAVEAYLAQGSSKIDLGREIRPEEHDIYPPDLEIFRVEVLNREGETTDALLMGEDFSIRLFFRINDPGQSYRIGIVFYAGDQTRVATVVNTYSEGKHISGNSDTVYVMSMKAKNLFLEGQYSMNMHVKSFSGQAVDVIEGVPLNVLPVSVAKDGQRGAGLVRLDGVWSGPSRVEEN